MKYLLLSCLLSAFALADTTESIPAAPVSVQTTSQRIIIDVRTEQEYKASHIAGAKWAPYDQIGSRITELVPDKSTPIMLYCKTGHRSSIALDALNKLGYTHVENGGGFDALQTRFPTGD